jgi:predicted transcriptional regulator
MCKEGKTIYQESRRQAGISQESAAEILHVSVESIGAYERGETRIPCEIVVRMADIYNDQMLAYRHMTEACPVGKECLPKFEHRTESTAVLFLQKEMADVADLSREMVTAACAGTVAALATARKEVDEMVSAGMAYLFSGKKKNRLC